MTAIVVAAAILANTSVAATVVEDGS